MDNIESFSVEISREINHAQLYEEEKSETATSFKDRRELVHQPVGIKSQTLFDSMV